MSRGSKSRDIEFQRAKNQASAAGYVKTLEQSKHKKHKEIAPHLRNQLNELSAKALESLKQQEESQEFAKTVMAR
jgi:hypothetical protein